MLHQDSLKYERLIGEMPVKDKVVREQEQSGKAFRSDTCDRGRTRKEDWVGRVRWKCSSGKVSASASGSSRADYPQRRVHWTERTRPWYLC